jgi:hypothetical protein
MTDSRLDQHLVIHSAATLGFAALCGAIGGALMRSWEVSVLMAGAVTTLGILAMRVGPVRRGINRLALAAVEARR